MDDNMWSQHTLDVAYMRDRKLGDGFVKVQVSDTMVIVDWMRGRESSKVFKSIPIQLISVTHYQTCGIDNEDNNIPMKQPFSKMLKLFYSTNPTSNDGTEFYFPEDASCWKHIIGSWISLHFRECLELPQLSHTYDAELAKQYYDDTVLLITKIMSDSSKNVKSGNGDTHKINSGSTCLYDSELLSILHDFSEMCLLDLEIKQEAFRSRELFVVMQNLIHAQLTEQLQLSHLANKDSQSANPHTDDEDIQNKLRKIMVEKSLIIHAALKVISNLLFSSECVHGRIGLISGIRPLNFSSWFQILVPDLFNGLSEQVGYVETEQDWEFFVGARDKTIRRMATEVDIESAQNETRQAKTLKSSFSNSQMFSSSFYPSGQNSPVRERGGTGIQTPVRMSSDAMFGDFVDISYISERDTGPPTRPFSPNISMISHNSPMRGLGSSGGSVFGSRTDLGGSTHSGSGAAPGTPNRASLLAPRQNSKARFTKLLSTPSLSAKFRPSALADVDQSAMITEQLNDYNVKLLETLGELRQSIVDEQSLIMFELCRIFTTECTKPIGGEKGIDFMEHTSHLVKRSNRFTGNRNGNAPHSAPPTNPVLLAVIPGDIFTTVKYWTNSVEDLVIRLSTLLSDWLHTHLLPVSIRAEKQTASLDFQVERQLISALASPMRKPRPKTPKSVRIRHPNKSAIENQEEHIAKQKELVRESLPSASKYADDHRRSRFVTQEIMLLADSHLLKIFALDSFKIREVLVMELKSYWQHIMNMLNVICPRPRKVADPESGRRVDGTKDDARQGGNFVDQLLAGCFAGKKTNGNDNIPKDILNPEKLEKPLSIVDYAGINEKQYDITKITPESWDLLLLARQNIEEIIGIIGLRDEVSFYATEATGVEPTAPLDDGATRRADQGSSGLLRRREDGGDRGRQLVLDRDDMSPVKPSRVRDGSARIQLPRESSSNKPSSILRSMREDPNSSSLSTPKRSNSPISNLRR